MKLSQLLIGELIRGLKRVVLLMTLAETIKELVSFILKGVDLLDHTSIFLLRTINHRVILIIRMVSARGISNTTLN